MCTFFNKNGLRKAKIRRNFFDQITESKQTTDCLICLLLIQDGNTPLHFAAKWNKAAVIDVLLKNKADADCRNKV